MENQTQQAQPQPKQKKKWNMKLWIVIFVVIILWIIGGVSLESAKELAQEKAQEAEKQEQEDKAIILGAQVESLQKQLKEKQQKDAELNQVNAIPIEPVELEIEQSKEEPEQEVVETQEEKFKVVNVIDGDTIKLDNGQVVRYIGIDTPETVHPSKPVQCFGKEASKKNEELVEGKEIRLVKDVSETDRYNRLLRYVYVGDTFVNDYLVRNGFANASNYPPDVKYQDQFKEAEKEARNNKRGLWADDACKVEVEPEPTPASAPIPTPAPTKSSESYTCNCSKTCAQMSSCAEAQYQLNVCGCSRRDGDKDGIACDADCQ